MIDKAVIATIAIGSFFTTFFAQAANNPNATEYGFEATAAIVVAGAVAFVFKLYDAAQKDRIKTLESEVGFYREKLLKNLEEEKEEK